MGKNQGQNNQIAAIVVTYNRKEMLVDCLNSLISQSEKPEAIFVVDNASTDGTQDELKKKGFFKKGSMRKKPKIIYLRLPHNTGGAGGFSFGLKKAYEGGYGYFWLMDDDVVVPRETLKELLFALKEAEKEEPNILAICPRVQHVSGIWEDDHHLLLNKLFLQDIPWNRKAEKKQGKIFLDSNSFVGPLIKREAVEKVGFPDAKFFIRGDDTEYTYRISRSGKILFIPQIVMIHRDEKKQLTKKDLWKLYYSFRNKVWFIKKFHPFHLGGYLYYFLSATKWSLVPLLTLGISKEVFYPILGYFSGLFNKKLVDLP